jgi:hypothetical protein
MFDPQSRAAPLVPVSSVHGVTRVTLVAELDEREAGLQSDVHDATVLLEQTLRGGMERESAIE